jgi:circadian clock protein KaiB
MDSLDKDSEKPFFELVLYVSGINSRSTQAIQNLKKICEEHLQGHYKLKIVDISRDLKKGESEKIVALPTLIKKLPLPVQRLIGELTDTQKVIIQLDIR